MARQTESRIRIVPPRPTVQIHLNGGKVLAAAFEELFPEARLTVDHSVASGGYFCQVDRYDSFGEEEIRCLEERMRELVEQDLPFAKLQAPLEEGIAFFSEKDYELGEGEVLLHQLT